MFGGYGAKLGYGKGFEENAKERLRMQIVLCSFFINN